MSVLSPLTENRKPGGKSKEVLLAVMLAMLADEQNRCKMLEERLERSSSSHINEAHLPLQNGRWGEGTSKLDVVSSVWRDEGQKRGCTKSVVWRGEAVAHEREGGQRSTSSSPSPQLKQVSANFSSDTTKGISFQNAGLDLQNF